MFCGGSFRSKTIEQNDEYKVVKVNNTQIKILRSHSFASAPSKTQGRKIFILPPKLPNEISRRILLASEKVCLIYDFLFASCQWRPFMVLSLKVIFKKSKSESQLKNNKIELGLSVLCRIIYETSVFLTSFIIYLFEVVVTNYFLNLFLSCI